MERAWSDEAIKARLLSDPTAALKEAGLAVPDCVTVKVVENTETLFHLVLPPRPDEELSDEALDKVAGGTGLCAPVSPGCFSSCCSGYLYCRG